MANRVAETRAKADIKAAIDLPELASEYGVKLRPEGRVLVGLCPFHDDHEPSFKISADGQHFKCYGCGVGGDVFTFIQTIEELAFPEALARLAARAGIELPRPSKNGRDRSMRAKPKRRPEVQKLIRGPFEYFSRVGDLVYTIYRTEQPNGSKSFSIEPRNLPANNRIIYRLPELDSGEDPVILTEGEGKADLLASLGYSATATPFGANSWRPQYAEALRGRHVVIWPDRDDSGTVYAENAARDLSPVVASLRYVQPPDYLSEGGDVVDVFQQHDAAEVRRLVDEAKPWAPAEGQEPAAEQNPLRAGVVLASDVEPKEVEWVWYPYLPRRFVTMIYGDGDVRKSWLAMAVAAGVTRGGKVTPYDECERPPGRVLYFSGEDDIEYALARKARGTEADLSRLHLRYGAFDWDEETLAYVEELVEEIKPELVIFDPVVSFQGDVRSNEAGAVRAGLERLGAIAKRHDCAVLLVHHVGKDRTRGVDQMHLGSVDYRNAARSTLVVGLSDPDSQMSPSVFVHRKHNVSPRRGQSIEFTTEEPWQFRWVGVSDKDADELYPVGKSARSSREAVDEVGEWLRELLKDGPKPVADIMEAAKQAGLSEKRVRTARERYCKTPRRVGGVGSDGHWVWELKDQG